MKLLILACATLFLFAGCKKTNADSNQIKASIHSTCISVINLEHDHSYAYFDAGQYYIGGYSEGDADELGVVFYTAPAKGTYDLASSGALGLFWDPGNDEVNEYGSISGTVEIKDIDISGTSIYLVEMKFSNVIVQQSSGPTFCVNEGLVFYASR